MNPLCSRNFGSERNGIFFDAGKANEGEITIRLNFPTTPSEIRDFVNVAKEIERQFGKAFLHSEEEDKGYTTASLESSIDDMIRFSLETLNRQCTENPDKQYILTLALFPWFVEKNKRAEYKECTSLDDFEEKMHSLQAGDYYYAKPSLFKDTNSGKNLAFYTLTDDCESVFPIHADDFLNMNDVKIRFSCLKKRRSLTEYIHTMHLWIMCGKMSHLLMPHM